MHGSYLSIIWSFWPISSSFALKYEFHLSLSSLEGLIDLEAWPDEFEYASPEMVSGLLRRTLVTSLTCPRDAGYPIDAVAIVEEVEIPETLLYTRNRMFQYWIQNLAKQTYTIHVLLAFRFIMQFYIFLRLFLVKTFKGPVGFPIILKAVLQGKLKGAQCSEPVKSSHQRENVGHQGPPNSARKQPWYRFYCMHFVCIPLDACNDPWQLTLDLPLGGKN